MYSVLKLVPGLDMVVYLKIVWCSVCCRLCWTTRTTAAIQDGSPSVSIVLTILWYQLPYYTSCDQVLARVKVVHILAFWILWSCNFTTSSLIIQLLYSWRSWEDTTRNCWLFLALCLCNLYVHQVRMTFLIFSVMTLIHIDICMTHCYISSCTRTCMLYLQWPDCWQDQSTLFSHIWNDRYVIPWLF